MTRGGDKIITTVNGLFNWIDDELNKREWSYSELARRAGVSQSMVSMVRNGQRGITAEFCAAIARALGENPEKVLRLAGLLPASAGKVADLLPDEGELIDMYRRATVDDRRRILVIVKGILLTAAEDA